MKSRLTKNQEHILGLIQNSQGHITAEQINFLLKSEGESMSLATIYRNLNLLYDKSLVNRVRHPEFGFIYDRNTRDHYHFYCQRCEKIVDVNISYQSSLNQLVEEELGCKVNRNEIIFEGICKECLIELKKEH